jgi:hypothetical protein
MNTDKLQEMVFDGDESDRARLIGLIAELRDVFDWPENITDINSPLYYSMGGIMGCPEECLLSMIAITKERNKKN